MVNIQFNIGIMDTKSDCYEYIYSTGYKTLPED
jgi:hypothetical protein